MSVLWALQADLVHELLGTAYAALRSTPPLEDFDAESSDADFLVEFAPDTAVGLSNFFGAKAELEKLLGRSVDLVEPGAIRNPFVLASIDRSREPVYAA